MIKGSRRTEVPDPDGISRSSTLSVDFDLNTCLLDAYQFNFWVV
jgi:hypothetical protein